MNEEMETELIKTDSRPDNLAVSEDASVDEAVLVSSAYISSFIYIFLNKNR